MRATMMYRNETATCCSCGGPIKAGSVRCEFEGLILCTGCGQLDDELRDGCALCRTPIDGDDWITVYTKLAPTVLAPAHSECAYRRANGSAFTETNP